MFNLNWGSEITAVDSFVSSTAGGDQSVQAVAIDYAKAHLRALGDIDSALYAVYIDAAASYFFEQTSRSPLTQTRDLLLDAFPFLGASGRYARIELPHPPLQSVVSVQYIDQNGVLQNFTDGASPATNFFTWLAPGGDYATVGFVEPLYGKPWPIARDQSGSVRIRYKCGYGDDSTSVPALVTQILCLLVAHFDQFRGAVHEARKGQVLELPYGIEATIEAFKQTAKTNQLLRRYGSSVPPGLVVGGTVVP
jgi:hypothetical protein